MPKITRKKTRYKFYFAAGILTASIAMRHQLKGVCQLEMAMLQPDSTQYVSLVMLPELALMPVHAPLLPRLAFSLPVFLPLASS